MFSGGSVRSPVSLLRLAVTQKSQMLRLEAVSLNILTSWSIEPHQVSQSVGPSYPKVATRASTSRTKPCRRRSDRPAATRPCEDINGPGRLGLVRPTTVKAASSVIPSPWRSVVASALSHQECGRRQSCSEATSPSRIASYRTWHRMTATSDSLGVRGGSAWSGSGTTETILRPVNTFGPVRGQATSQQRG